MLIFYWILRGVSQVGGKNEKSGGSRQKVGGKNAKSGGNNSKTGGNFLNFGGTRLECRSIIQIRSRLTPKSQPQTRVGGTNFDFRELPKAHHFC